MSNLYAQFLELIPDPPIQVGTVLYAYDGTVTVALAGGGIVVARGDALADSRVYLRGGVVEGTAPDLATHIISI